MRKRLRLVCRYVFTIISVKILFKCDETSLTVTRIAASRLSEKWPLDITYEHKFKSLNEEVNGMGR